MINETFNPDAAIRARWMVVDDDAGVREIVSALLSAASDAEICSFASSAEALAHFAAQPLAFELIVSDFDMPGMNGVEFCRRLLELAPSQKIILATGSEVFSEAAAQEHGFCGLLHKPFSLAQLLHALERAGLNVVVNSTNNQKNER
jgi:CheY-like chemotaxis protein